MRHGKFLPRYPNYTYDKITGNLTTIQYISVNYVMFGIYQMSQVELISQAGFCCETAQVGFQIQDLWLAQRSVDLIGWKKQYENPSKSSLCTEMNNDCMSKNISGSGFFLQQFQELSLVDENVPDSAEDTLIKSFGILFSTYIFHFIILITFLLVKNKWK